MRLLQKEQIWLWNVSRLLRLQKLCLLPKFFGRKMFGTSALSIRGSGTLSRGSSLVQTLMRLLQKKQIWLQNVSRLMHLLKLCLLPQFFWRESTWKSWISYKSKWVSFKGKANCADPDETATERANLSWNDHRWLRLQKLLSADLLFLLFYGKTIFRECIGTLMIYSTRN